jgi:iron complex outermembrane receptor protein
MQVEPRFPLYKHQTQDSRDPDNLATEIFFFVGEAGGARLIGSEPQQTRHARGAQPMHYRPKTDSRIRLPLLMGMGVLGVGAIASTAAVAGDVNSQVSVNIPQQSLASALTSLANQADLQILFSQDLVANKRAKALSGSFSGTDALRQLLSGSDLEYVVNGPDTIVIQVRSAPHPERTSQISEGPRTETATGATSAEEPGGSLEEIVVTAQKRSERLQDVPLAVTAISGETLSSAGVNDTTRLANLTPSLTFTEGAQPNNKNFRIRGIGTAVFGQGLEPSVATVVDGVVLARGSQGFSDLADIERVEVLRGPQGTLFGKNATAGVINVITKRPSSRFEATTDVTVAEEQEYRARGSVSGPLTDTLSARLSGYYNNVGGTIHNITYDRDVNGYKGYGARGKLQWQPTDQLDLLLAGDYHKTDANCCSSQYVLVVNPVLQQVLSPIVANWNNRYEQENTITYANTQQWTGSLEGNLNLDALTLTSLTSYQNFYTINNQPIDRLNTPVPLYIPATNGSLDINGGTVDLHQVSQEFRVTSPSSKVFSYVGGLYYLDLDLHRTFQRRIGSCAPGGNPAAFGQPCAVPLYRSQGGFNSALGTRNVALFGQTDFGLIGDLSGLAGVRAQYEEISYAGSRPNQRLVTGDLPLVGVTPSTGSGRSHDTAVTGKVGLKYEFNPQAQTYLTWSTGYKGAGYETEFTADFANQTPIRPETARAWELGYKAQMFDGRLTLNTALFHAKYKDLQVLANRGNPDLGIIQFVTTNAGSSTTQGVEIELGSRPFRGFTLSAGATYLSSSVDIDGLNCPLSQQAAAPVINGTAPINTCYRAVAGASPIQNVRGGDLPNAPRWRGNLTARYDFNIPGTSLGSFVQVSGNSQSKINFVLEQDPLTVQGAYTTADASLGFHDQSEHYRLSFFVRNLFDKHYVTLLARSSTLSTATVTPNQLTGNIPKEANRYFGATFGVSF